MAISWATSLEYSGAAGHHSWLAPARILQKKAHYGELFYVGNCACAYTYLAPVGLLEVNMSERPDVNDPLEDDEPVPQTPDEIADDDDDADPLEEDDDDESSDPSTVI